MPQTTPGHTLGLQVSPQLRDALDRASEMEGMNRSMIVRQMIVAGLKERNLWPPKHKPAEQAG